MNESKKTSKDESLFSTESLRGSVEASGTKTIRPKTPPPVE